MRLALPMLAALLTATACDQTRASGQEIDACGVLVRAGNCVLFEGGGGKYYVPEPGRFRVGDAVRVVGTVDPDCVTICKESDGCIRGGVLYDPAVLPCGTRLPSFPGDILTGACSAAGTGLLTLTLAGLWHTRVAHASGTQPARLCHAAKTANDWSLKADR